MRFVFLAAAVLSVGGPALATGSESLYSACVYQDPQTGVNPFTQLFVIKPDALENSYGDYTRAKNSAWEQAMAADEPQAVRNVTSYYPSSLVGQFMKFAEAKGDSHANCFVTTDKDRAFTWYRARLADRRKYEATSIKDWRPTRDAFLSIEPWPPQ